MALTDCLECGCQVSDAASACPNCGCPIAPHPSTSATISPSNPCPFCKEELKAGATTCGTCWAKWGYYAFGSTFERRTVVTNGVYVPAGMILVSLILGAIYPGPSWIVLGLLSLIALVTLWNASIALMRGPRWWASREVGQ